MATTGTTVIFLAFLRNKLCSAVIRHSLVLVQKEEKARFTTDCDKIKVVNNHLVYAFAGGAGAKDILDELQARDKDMGDVSSIIRELEGAVVKFSQRKDLKFEMIVIRSMPWQNILAFHIYKPTNGQCVVRQLNEFAFAIGSGAVHLKEKLPKDKVDAPGKIIKGLLKTAVDADEHTGGKFWVLNMDGGAIDENTIIKPIFLK